MSLGSVFTTTMLAFLPLSGTATTYTAHSGKDKVTKGTELMKQVFYHFHSNYEMERIHKVGFYQESMSKARTVYYLAEGIVDIYIPCNLNQISNAAIKPVRTRKKAYKKVNEEKLLMGNASDMARSSIWRPNSFLNEKNRVNYTYRYDEDTLINSLDACIISFKPENGKGHVSGKLYVDKETFAIFKIEYKPDVTGSEIWKSVSWTEDFVFNEGAYDLHQVTYRGVSKDHYSYDAKLVMSQLEVVHSIPASEAYISERVSLFEKAGNDFSDSFWSGYQHLKPASETENEEIIASKESPGTLPSSQIMN